MPVLDTTYYINRAYSDNAGETYNPQHTFTNKGIDLTTKNIRATVQSNRHNFRDRWFLEWSQSSFRLNQVLSDHKQKFRNYLYKFYNLGTDSLIASRICTCHICHIIFMTLKHFYLLQENSCMKKVFFPSKTLLTEWGGIGREYSFSLQCRRLHNDSAMILFIQHSLKMVKKRKEKGTETLSALQSIINRI